VTIIDLTREQTDPPSPATHYLIGPTRGVLKRNRARIVGIVVRQTGSFFTPSPAQVRASGGDENLARHRMGLRVPCHVIAFTDGAVCHVNRFEWHVKHAYAFDAMTLGLSIEGIYPGLLSAPRKSGEVALGARTLRAAREAIDYLVAEGKRQRIQLLDIFAARQASGAGRGDPGEAIWKKVVLEHAVKKHGLRAQPDEQMPAPNTRIGPGRPIPVEWDPKFGEGHY
jgi:hypothetical protein